jgi:predicted metal-dependent hydrolase
LAADPASQRRSAMSTNQEPAELDAKGPEVIVRRMRFDLDEGLPRYWHSDSPYLTHLFSALSIVFPEGERFFIDSVRHFEKGLQDPGLREEVRAFIRQEAHHGHQHGIYNRLISIGGPSLDRYEVFLGKVLGFVRRHAPHKMQLAATITLEHFTAILANQLLSNPRLTEGMHPAVRPLWIWHAVEETEHKAVCFDVYRAVEGGELQRILMMARMMFGFPFFITCIQLSLLLRDGKLFDLRDFRRYFAFVWGREGVVRALWPEIKSYYRRDFHPWQCDNRDLIDDWAHVYAEHQIGA